MCLGRNPRKEGCIPWDTTAYKGLHWKRRCDLPGRKLVADMEWMLLACSHSFHITCLSQTQCCPLCEVFLKEKAQELFATAILNPYSKNQSTGTNEQNQDNSSSCRCAHHGVKPAVSECVASKRGYRIERVWSYKTFKRKYHGDWK